MGSNQGKFDFVYGVQVSQVNGVFCSSNKEFTSRIFIVFLPFCNYITSVEIKGITGMYILI